MIQEEIIGVDAKQFSQIVMIAQGNFASCFRLKTDKRKEDPRKDIQDEIFSDLAERLGKGHAGSKGKYEDAREILIAVKNMETAEGLRLPGTAGGNQTGPKRQTFRLRQLELAESIVKEDDNRVECG